MKAGRKKERNRLPFIITFLFLCLFFCLAALLDWKSLFRERATVLENRSVPTLYRAEVEVDPVQKKVHGFLEVSAINNTGSGQKRVYFHLYPNLFREDRKLETTVWRYVLGEKPSPGKMEIHRVEVNGKSADYEVKETILAIRTPGWSKGETISVAIDFDIFLPKNNGRMSYDEHAIWLGNWLPIRAVYDRQGWNLDPYHPVGDPFYSEVADYEVKVTVPANYTVASSGEELQQKAEERGGKKAYSFEARNVRDFAMAVMDGTYRELREQAGRTLVRTWCRQGDDPRAARMIHEAGVKALRYFHARYGEYPYPEYDIVRTGGFFGGMEYPALVFVQGTYFENGPDVGVAAVAHETAHQWWYGLVGNDEVDEPWVDESLAEYATLRFLLDEYPELGERLLQNKRRTVYYASAFERKRNYLGNGLDRFKDWDAYAALVYGKGPMMFYELEQAAGIGKMNAILKEYFGQYRYKNARGNDLVRVFERHLGPAVKDYFETWLHGGISSFPINSPAWRE